ncbi:unnamed protein product, partial [marine sediment metagenome]
SEELDTIDAQRLISQTRLTPEEEKTIETIINDVLDTPIAPKRELPGGVDKIKEGQTAVNPKTGARIIFRDGKWQTIR